MIRLPQSEQFKISVYLKSGECYENKDITNQPFGENENYVSFWHDECIMIYPIEEVKFLKLIPE